MRILVLSDTHRSLNRALLLMNDLIYEIDYVFHLGDNTEDADFLRDNYKLPVISVAGNCDSDCSVEDEKVIELANKKIFMTHGHKYGVKYDTADRLIYRAQEVGADICLFGHTHVPFLGLIRGMVVMNPGSLSQPRGNAKAAYGIIKIEDDDIYPSIVEWR
ncbi:MAG: metallophosphoesterase [Firmicutes bacterium]|nr:metallophosphoesterase [Bacillota bacterium]